VKIAKKPFYDVDDEIIPSEIESISTAIDAVEDEDDIPSNKRVSESPVDNMFANLVMDYEPLATSVIKKKSPRRTSPTVTTKKPSPSPVKFHHTPRTISDISDEDHTIVEEIPEEISTVNYTEDFSSGPTESSTPRTLRPSGPTESSTPRTLRPSAPTNIRIEKQPQYGELFVL
jgi:hypothetical protein